MEIEFLARYFDGFIVNCIESFLSQIMNIMLRAALTENYSAAIDS